MLGGILALLLGVGLLWVLYITNELKRGSYIGWILLGGYCLRLLIQAVIRDIQFFSHELGSDAEQYEAWARVIALIWNHTGIHFITQNEFPEIGPTSLPPNLFALVIYVNDGPTRLGCTAIVALASALTVLNIYKLSLEFGAVPRQALIVSSLLYFDPAMVHYSSDMYKDPLVICFTIGALASSIRLTFRFSILHIALGIVCVAALWYVRFYLVFVTVAPLVVGLVGVGSRSFVRPAIAALLMGAIGLALISFTDVLQLASERASQTFEFGTSVAVHDANASGGSGIDFDDNGSPYGALLPKLAYTLFSPFLWASGSIGFHIGKLDAVFWYYLMYRAVRAVRTVDRRLLLALVTFLAPCTLMYAMSMSNVGLIVRQRLVIVGATAVLAALYRASPSRALAPATAPA